MVLAKTYSQGKTISKLLFMKKRGRWRLTSVRQLLGALQARARWSSRIPGMLASFNNFPFAFKSKQSNQKSRLLLQLNQAKTKRSHPHIHPRKRDARVPVREGGRHPLGLLDQNGNEGVQFCVDGGYDSGHRRRRRDERSNERRRQCVRARSNRCICVFGLDPVAKARDMSP